MEKKEEILINEPEMVSEKPSKVKFILAILASTLILATVTTLLIGHLKFDWFKSNEYNINAKINRQIYQANYFSEKKTLTTKISFSNAPSMNKMYDRMEDVELVLRFFAMRHLDEYSGDLSGFLDSCLVKYNQLNSEQLNVLSDLFVKNINIAYSLFEKNAFKFYRKSYNSWSWSKPSKMIFDAMMIAIQETDDLSTTVSNPKQNKEKLREFYKIHKENFNGKVQSKKEIRNRADLFKKFIIENCK